MYQRQRFVLDAEHAPCAFAELCRRYGISRKTGYKWLDRYARLGPDSLADRSHRPQQCPHATAPAVIRQILQLRKSWRWGARKLHELLLDGCPAGMNETIGFTTTAVARTANATCHPSGDNTCYPSVETFIRHVLSSPRAARLP
jgi:hypothetical protein